MSFMQNDPLPAAQQRVARRRSQTQLTTTDTVADTATCACLGCNGMSPKGNAHLRSHRGGPHAQSREPQKASQAHIAVASRTPLSRRRTNPQAFASFSEYARLRDSCGEL